MKQSDETTMHHLCIRELAEIVGGRLRFGCLPPLGGEQEPLGRLTLDSHRAEQGDVFWGFGTGQENTAWRAEEAYARGALGAVVSGRRLEPWAGTFSLEVEDTEAAMLRLAQALPRRISHMCRGYRRGEWSRCLAGAGRQHTTY